MYKSPEDYLYHIREIYSNPISQIQSEENIEFKEIYKKKISSLKGFEKELIYKEDSRSFIAKSLWNSLYTILPQKITKQLNNRIAVDYIDDMIVNALCTRSKEGYYVIGINSGLMTFFNKLSKMHSSLHNINDVIYCNRCSNSMLSVEIMMKWIVEVVDHYRSTGRPLGPQIHLKDQTESHHLRQLHCWELFVLSHELGHVLANHLSSSKRTIHDDYYLSGNTKKSISHALEYEADTIGYYLYRLSLIAELNLDMSEDFNEGIIFLPIITLFNLFTLITSKSESHPQPRKRLLNIAKNIYGNEYATSLKLSYSDFNYTKKLRDFNLIPDTTLINKRILNTKIY